MNKSLGLALGLLAVIALLVWFFTTGPSSLTERTNTNTSATTTHATTSDPVINAASKASGSATKTPAKGVPNSTTYHSLLTQKGSYECDYSGANAAGQTSNVIYIYGGKMRGEFRTMSPGESTANLFVYDGRYLYQWKEGMSVGTRTILTSLSQLPLVIPKDLTSGAIIGDSYTSVGWQCHSWLTNQALLTPPTYVTFN